MSIENTPKLRKYFISHWVVLFIKQILYFVISNVSTACAVTELIDEINDLVFIRNFLFFLTFWKSGWN